MSKENKGEIKGKEKEEMNVVLDTTGMLHTCGHKLSYAGIDNGCYVLVCLNKKCNNYSYRIPIEDLRKLPFPWEIPREKGVRTYKCTVCKTQITEGHGEILNSQNIKLNYKKVNGKFQLVE